MIKPDRSFWPTFSTKIINLILLIVLVFGVSFLSLVPHKEDRFLTPFYPIFFYFIMVGLLKWRKFLKLKRFVV